MDIDPYSTSWLKTCTIILSCIPSSLSTSDHSFHFQRPFHSHRIALFMLSIRTGHGTSVTCLLHQASMTTYGSGTTATSSIDLARNVKLMKYSNLILNPTRRKVKTRTRRKMNLANVYGPIVRLERQNVHDWIHLSASLTEPSWPSTMPRESGQV